MVENEKFASRDGLESSPVLPSQPQSNELTIESKIGRVARSFCARGYVSCGRVSSVICVL